MSQPFISEIRNVAFSYAPVGWAVCDGSLLSIAQNTALFALIGTTYGGNGSTNFALPDFRGRVAVGQGDGPGLSPYILGQQGGEDSHTLQTGEIPAHNHNMPAASANGTTKSPKNAVFAHLGALPLPPELYATTQNAAAYTGMVDMTGSSQGHENRQPFLSTLFIIALTGIFPSRS